MVWQENWTISISIIKLDRTLKKVNIMLFFFLICLVPKIVLILILDLSIRYTAPELISPHHDSVYKIYNEKTEVWSFGVLFYEILTKGELPYKG